MKIKAVLFDLGNTLVKTAPIPEIYRRIFEVHGVKVSCYEILKAHEANGKEFDVVKGMLESGMDFWVMWNLKVLERLGISEDKEFLARKIDELWWDHADLEVYSDVMETLAQLKAKGLKVAIVTNGLKSDFQRILGKLGLTECFDVVVGLDSCNKGKPDKEIFHFALEKLHVSPKEAIFVGDSVKYDYEGAKNAGLKPLLIDREGKTLVDLNTIASLTEVLHYIQNQ